MLHACALLQQASDRQQQTILWPDCTTELATGLPQQCHSRHLVLPAAQGVPLLQGHIAALSDNHLHLVAVAVGAAGGGGGSGGVSVPASVLEVHLMLVITDNYHRDCSDLSLNYSSMDTGAVSSLALGPS